MTKELETHNFAKQKALESVPICDVIEIYEVLMMPMSEQLGSEESTVTSFVTYKTDLNNRGIPTCFECVEQTRFERSEIRVCVSSL